MQFQNLPNYNFPKIKFCKNGHAIIGENSRIARRRVLCRQCRRVQEKKTQSTGNLGENLVRKVIGALNDGMTINRMTGWEKGAYVGGKVIPRDRLLAFCADKPKLGKRILKKLRKML